MQNNYDEEFKKELESRISAMERDDYEFPEPFSRKDWVCAIAVILAAGIFVIIGGML